MTKRIDLEEIAGHLTGRSVEIRRIGCTLNGGLGETHREGEKYVITIPPWFDEKMVLASLCHEAAHVYLRHPMPDISGNDRLMSLRSGTFRFDDQDIKEYAEDPQEAQARAQAMVWWKYADSNRWRYMDEFGKLSRLRALLDWNKE